MSPPSSFEPEGSLPLPTSPRSVRLKRRITFGLSVLLGFLIWALSPTILGRAEPWDSPYPFYSMVFISGGALIALIERKSDALCGLGAWVGQLLALGTLPGMAHGWFPIGVITTGIGSLFALLGNCALGAILSRRHRGVR